MVLDNDTEVVLLDYNALYSIGCALECQLSCQSLTRCRATLRRKQVMSGMIQGAGGRSISLVAVDHRRRNESRDRTRNGSALSFRTERS
jgi:hypothetical protein